MRMRDRRGPLAAVLLVAAYLAALLWSQIWLAEALGAPVHARLDPALVLLLKVNAFLLAWRVLMRVFFTTSAYGWGRDAVGAAADRRQCHRHARRRLARFRFTLAAAPSAGTRPATCSRPSCRGEAVAALPGAGGVRMGRGTRGSLGALPGAELFEVEPSEAKAPPIAATNFRRSNRCSLRRQWSRADYAPPRRSLSSSSAAIRYARAVGVPVSMRPGLVAVYRLPPATRAAEPSPRPNRYANLNRDVGEYLQLPPLDEGPLSRIDFDASLPQRSTVVARRQSRPRKRCRR